MFNQELALNYHSFINELFPYFERHIFLFPLIFYSVDVFNFLQPVLENNLNSDMSVPKIVESCRQEVSFSRIEVI